MANAALLHHPWPPTPELMLGDVGCEAIKRDKVSGLVDENDWVIPSQGRLFVIPLSMDQIPALQR